MQIMRKLCGNYAEIMRPLCGHVAPHDYAKIMRNYAKIMQIMRTPKNYADYADPTLLMHGLGSQGARVTVSLQAANEMAAAAWSA